MKHSLVALLVPFLIGASGTGFAAEAGNLLIGEFDATSRKERIEIAKDILSDVEELSNYVRTLSPSESDWVIAEQEAIASLKGTPAYYERMGQLYASAEFQNLKLKTLLDGIERELHCVISENTNTRREIFCWSTASLYLSNRSTINDAISLLIKHDRLPEDIGKKARLVNSDLGYSWQFDWMAYGINEYIVIPYLAGRITE